MTVAESAGRKSGGSRSHGRTFIRARRPEFRKGLAAAPKIKAGMSGIRKRTNDEVFGTKRGRPDEGSREVSETKCDVPVSSARRGHRCRPRRAPYEYRTLVRVRVLDRYRTGSPWTIRYAVSTSSRTSTSYGAGQRPGPNPKVIPRPQPRFRSRRRRTIHTLRTDTRRVPYEYCTREQASARA